MSFRINEGPAIPMIMVNRADPSVNELFTRYANSKKSWVQAMPSTHLFEADLPDSTPAGVHTLSVEAVDEFGQTHHGHAILEVTGR